MSDAQTPAGSPLSISGSAIGTALTDLLLADDIQPGSEPSYQLCKDIYLYHPLGAKMAEAPINLAQSQAREIEVVDAPERVRKAFEKQWAEIGADELIHNVQMHARIYGIASVVMGAKGIDPAVPIPNDRLATAELFFNILDPLNTAGSLVLNQDPNSPDFQKTTVVTALGETYHRSRCCIVMNERPIYIAFSGSAFGFSGRSVYQRALYPLKSFVQSMRTDDMITRKAGVLVAKMKAPGSIINQAMASIMGFKRSLLKQAQTDNVLGIDVEEAVETLNMQNIDGAGTFARTNILKNIATSADMPAMLLENETLVQGFGEGTEDAKQIARYIERFREQMRPAYEWFDGIVQHRAWNENFFANMQKEFPDQYGKMSYEAALSEWQNNFRATWPSLLIEPESERVKTDDVKLRAIVAVVEAFAPLMDPENKARLMAWASDNIADTRLLFGVPLTLDLDALRDFNPMEAMMGGASGEGGGASGGGKQPNVMPFKMPTGMGA